MSSNFDSAEYSMEKVSRHIPSTKFWTNEKAKHNLQISKLVDSNV